MAFGLRLVGIPRAPSGHTRGLIGAALTGFALAVAW
jgi:hypothetical protein